MFCKAPGRMVEALGPLCKAFVQTLVPIPSSPTGPRCPRPLLYKTALSPRLWHSLHPAPSTICPSCRTEKLTSSPSTPSGRLPYVPPMFSCPLVPFCCPAIVIRVAPLIAIGAEKVEYRDQNLSWRLNANFEMNCRSMLPSRPILAIRAPLWAWPRWLTSSGTSS